jgi:hypothetical protein
MPPESIGIVVGDRIRLGHRPMVAAGRTTAPTGATNAMNLLVGSDRHEPAREASTVR